ncbi:uncharacterized protein LOC129777031 [Toxorhynchites rutilus septentrionalis]|uniref:uncharacterized protein LOC129777031 n=1 Tax=Toxorhynchites rutilus septentrionalis TaxID=329112 RepID=UPI00247A648C|nr:uncharacterized protein LOC129777031 [Toxorhynchites rutilus septentrionalis]
MWRIVNLLLLLSSRLSCDLVVGSYIDNVIEQQHAIINEMNQNFTELEKESEKFIDLGTFIAKHEVPPKIVKITNTVAVKVPVPYPVKIPHPVPVPVPVTKTVPVPVPKIIRLPEAAAVQPTDGVPIAESVSAIVPTVPVLSSRSSGPTSASNLLTGEQETAHSNQNEQVEYTRSYPIHSVYDVGADYNPYMGNRQVLFKQSESASEPQPTRHYSEDFKKLEEYSSSSAKQSLNQNSRSFHTTLKPESIPRSTHGYREYYSTVQPEVGSSAGTPQPEVVHHAYKSPKSVFYSSDTDKYPAPKFPRPSHSAFPTIPTYSTKDIFEEQNYKIYHPKPTATHPTFKDSYPHYEQPDAGKYYQQKPTAAIYHDYTGQSEQSGHRSKQLKYIENYQKPTEMSYSTTYHDTDHGQSGETSSQYKQYKYQDDNYASHEESYADHNRPSKQYQLSDFYSSSEDKPETQSYSEHKESQNSLQKYKYYYPKPTPVSEALTYLEGKLPSNSANHKEYYSKPQQSYYQKLPKEHETRYASKPTANSYNFPSDAHLHPSYQDTVPSKAKTHSYYPSVASEQHQFEESPKSEYKFYQYVHHPSSTPASHQLHSQSYDQGTGGEDDYQQQQQRQHHQQYTSGASHYGGTDMLESSSKDQTTYERAVESDHRAAHPNDYAEHSHEHLHHHHHQREAAGGRGY